MKKEPLFAFLVTSRQKEIDEYFINNGTLYLKDALQHGYANGYVAVPPTHPFHGMFYDDVNERVDIHGGLTFCCSAEKLFYLWPEDCIECIGFERITEIPKDYYVFGFDTMHCGDGPHLDREWCVEETKRLMEQLENEGKMQKVC